MWDNIPVAFHEKLTDNFDFNNKCGNYYIYAVPDDWEYPYVTSFAIESSSWMSLGDIVSGEEIEEYPFWVHALSPSDCREITNIINDTFHLMSDIDIDGYELLMCKRAIWTKPYSDEESDIWYQLISFNTNFEEV